MKILARWLRTLADRIDGPADGMTLNGEFRGNVFFVPEVGLPPGFELPSAALAPPPGWTVREKGGYSPRPEVYDLDSLPNPLTNPPPGNGVRRDHSL